MDVLKEATIITIAHRLATIIDYDKVMVMQNGELVQFGEPHMLLSNPKTDGKNVFLSMVNATGSESSAYLKRKAREAYEKRRVIINWLLVLGSFFYFFFLYYFITTTI